MYLGPRPVMAYHGIASLLLLILCYKNQSWHWILSYKGCVNKYV